ncbi:transposon tf2-6 polyprotein [Plakobranchus ocellatus]|uniref:Transposon tf2-6 polyprotein n=1 Tax=Plakobranchus ocellatus TaxID=259542 RepID=A0AAV4BJ22_9GAST|nr:transposon tf2-6 polyprotein [Plakobranchus ocellatus]
MERKPGESLNALASRIHQEAATCDFASIKDALGEAMRTRFACSIHNEVIIKALFKSEDDELTFTSAIEIAAEVEEVTRVAKETLGSPDMEIHKVLKKKPPAKSSYNKPAAPHPNFQRNRSQPHSQK